MNGRNLLVWLGAGIVFSGALPRSGAASADTPYQGVVVRNVFGLKPALPPPPYVEPPKPLHKFTLTGITTMAGKKLALLQATAPAKPGAKTEQQGMTLAVGQREGDVEVLEIDEQAGVVKVSDYGTITILTWENNGIKVATVAPIPSPRPPGIDPRPPSHHIPASTSWPAEVTDPVHQTLLDAVYKQKNAQAIANGTMPDIPGDNPLVSNGTPAQTPTSTRKNVGLPRPPTMPPLMPQ